MQHKPPPAFTLGCTETCRVAAIHLEQLHLPHEVLGDLRDQDTADIYGSPIGMYLYTETHMYAEILVILLLQCLTGPREDKALQ